MTNSHFLKALKLIPLLLFLFISSAASAMEPHVQKVSAIMEHQDLKGGLFMVADFTRSLKKEEVLASGLKFISYQEYIQTYPMDGTDFRNQWIRFDLLNEGEQDLPKILFIEDWVSNIQIWKKVEGKWQHLQTKDFEDDGIYPSEVTPFPNFNLIVEPGLNQFLVRSDGFNTQVKEFSIYSPNQFFKEKSKENVSYAMIIGILLIMGLYNLLLSISFKSAEGGYFAAYIFSILLFLINRDRLFEAWFNLPNGPSWWVHMGAMDLFFALGFYFQSQYCIQMLGLTKKNKIQLGLIYFPIGLLVINIPFVFIDIGINQMIMNNAAGLFVVTLLVMSFVHATQKQPKAIFLFISLFPAVAGGLLEMASIQTGVKLIANSWQLGISLEVVILSTYLAFRIKRLTEEKETSDRLLLSNLQSQAAILEEKVAQRTSELQSVISVKDKFFSIISHDLRGPLGSLSIIFNDVIESHKNIDEEMFEATKKSTKNLYNMLNELLDWSRSQSGHLQAKPTHFNFRDLVTGESELVKQQASFKKIELNLELSQSLFAFADETMIKTVVRNLLSNAIKFTASGGKITMGTAQVDREARFFIQDNGKGIPTDLLSKLFKIEESVGSSLGTASETGSGLGLILCQEFIDKNQGKINVESQVGKGSRFWFSLPWGDETLVASSPPMELPIATQKITALLVEDNPLHVLSSSEVLKSLSISFAVATDGKQALNALRNAPQDVVLMDIDMPIMDGITALKEIRKTFTTQPFIIALSSHEKDEISSSLEGVSFDGYLSKPLESGELLGLLVDINL